MEKGISTNQHNIMSEIFLTKPEIIFVYHIGGQPFSKIANGRNNQIKTRALYHL